MELQVIFENAPWALGYTRPSQTGHDMGMGNESLTEPARAVSLTQLEEPCPTKWKNYAQNNN
eukprot:3278126-Amphidinium_carterae.1